jgi:hypothetical protein
MSFASSSRKRRGEALARFHREDFSARAIAGGTTLVLIIKPGFFGRGGGFPR